MKTKFESNYWILLDKPIGMSSTRASSRVKKIVHAKSAGHCGTLDPLASGLLPIALNEATKSMSWVLATEKTYEFIVEWGVETSTGDVEGEVISRSERFPCLDSITRAISHFLGEIDQVPPRYAALKIDGRRAYDLARSGVDFEIKPRKVSIFSLELLEILSDRHARFQVVCGPGTYVRSLARDIACKCGTVGHVTALRRIAVGHFHVRDAISLDYLENVGHIPVGSSAVLEIQQALADIPALSLLEKEWQKLQHGNAIINRWPVLGPERSIALGVYQEQAVAIVCLQGELLQPVRVFNIL